jgi:hypothetical protein
MTINKCKIEIFFDFPAFVSFLSISAEKIALLAGRRKIDV